MDKRPSKPTKPPLGAAHKHPGLELIEARIRLANRPTSDAALRKVRELEAQKLEKATPVHLANLTAQRNAGFSKPILHQPPQEETIDVKLERLRKELNSIPTWERARRMLAELKLANVESRIRARAGAETLNTQPTEEATQKAYEETKNKGANNLENNIRANLDIEPMTLRPAGEKAVAPDQAWDIPKTATGGDPHPDSAPAVQNPDQKISNEALDYVHESIWNADRNAMFFLAVLMVTLSFVLTHNAPAGWFKSIAQWSVEDYFGMVAMLGLTVAASMMLAVLFLSLKDSDRGFRFLNAMTKPNREGTQNSEIPQPAALIGLLQNDFYELLRVCDKKHRILRYGFWTGCVGALASLLFLILSKKPHPVFHRYY